MSVSALKQLRLVALLEGLSFLLLLFVAMPLKYGFGQPLGVRVLGSVHGILFVLFIGALLRVSTLQEWKLSRVAVAFFWSCVPFGTFVLDRSLQRELAAAQAAPATAATPSA